MCVYSDARRWRAERRGRRSGWVCGSTVTPSRPCSSACPWQFRQPTYPGSESLRINGSSPADKESIQTMNKPIPNRSTCPRRRARKAGDRRQQECPARASPVVLATAILERRLNSQAVGTGARTAVRRPGALDQSAEFGPRLVGGNGPLSIVTAGSQSGRYLPRRPPTEPPSYPSPAGASWCHGGELRSFADRRPLTWSPTTWPVWAWSEGGEIGEAPGPWAGSGGSHQGLTGSGPLSATARAAPSSHGHVAGSASHRSPTTSPSSPGPALGGHGRCTGTPTCFPGA